MDYTADMINRLRRIEGQVRGVQRMMEQHQECKDVLVQLSAVRAAVDKSIALIAANNLEKCIRDEIYKNGDGDTQKFVQDALKLLLKSR